MHLAQSSPTTPCIPNRLPARVIQRSWHSFQRLHVQHDTLYQPFRGQVLDSYACLRCGYREPPAYKYSCLFWSRVRRPHARIARPTAESSGASSSAVGAAGSDAPKVPKTAFFDGLERPIGATGQEWHPLLALAIFALGYFNHLTLNSSTLFKVTAVSGPVSCHVPDVLPRWTSVVVMQGQPWCCIDMICTFLQAFAIFQVASSAVAILFNEVRFDKVLHPMHVEHHT